VLKNRTGQSSRTLVNGSHQRSSAGLIIRQKEPLNLETPLDQVDSYLTPTELFYVRSHFPAPKLDSASYRLQLDGAIRNPFSLSYRDLRDMPCETRVATLECAGNGRVFLVPQVPGAQWELGAVGNAEWTGGAAGRFVGARRHGRRRLRDRARGSGSRNTGGTAHTAGADLVLPESAATKSNSAGSIDRLSDEWL
jgi:hypothetical protein